MPVPLIAQGITEGVSSIPYAVPVLRAAPWLLLLAALKYYFGGARNTSERLMHSKVVMITGGTSGIGAAIVHDLASRGAQIILLTQHSPSDLFLVDYINDVRKATGNQLIYAEQVDLSSLHSIRTFATRWVDNAPPRRLDMIILCAHTTVPSGVARKPTVDGLDEEWQVNYLANFHLLSILSPALRAQPPDRDVRIIFATCSSYAGASLDLELAKKPVIESSSSSKSSSKQTSRGRATGTDTKQQQQQKQQQKKNNMYGMSKLALMSFAQSFQKHLSSYKRPDNFPPNTRVLIVDPGLSRTPGTRRWLTGGSLWGLLLYLLTWPLWWLILKSPQQGAQSFLYAAMDAKFGRGTTGGWLIRECQDFEKFARSEVRDEAIGKRIWEFSEKQIQEKEKEGAVRRALEKKENKAAAASSSSSSANSSSLKEQTPGSRRSRKATR
ncbi:hypothetical protein VTN00DRAFT_9949 [Thermoascus crustaceus]|uniref:uncharacterized protein n=1 Tax=Thermoascus crustaceus TaxID=5088 RepID=UPI00374396D5